MQPTQKQTKVMVVDRISALPDEVIYHILSFLRVDEAVSTSVLSKTWRYLWTFNPKMCFPYYDDLNGGRCSISVINQCIKQYQAKQLQALQINVRVDEDASAQIQHWIDFAVQRKIEELTVQAFWFEVPDSIYSAQALQSLTLNYCRLQRPSVIKSFDSLESLKYLYLEGEVFDGAIEALLSKCRSLQTLHLTPYTISTPPLNLSIFLPQLQDLLIGSSSIFGSLEICAPTLRVISLSGYIYHKLELHHSPLLERTDFLLDIDPDAYRSPCYDSMENIKILHITHAVFEMIYTANYMSGGRRLELNNLRKFYLKNVENLNSIYPLVSFFKGCSALKEVHLHFCGTSSPNLDMEKLEALDDKERLTFDFGNYFFSRLRRVELTGFSGQLKEIILVKFLLQKATTLHLLHLQMNKMLPNDMEFILEHIFSLPRISPHADIQYETSEGNYSSPIASTDI